MDAVADADALQRAVGGPLPDQRDIAAVLNCSVA
jgi:hypothetical protein